MRPFAVIVTLALVASPLAAQRLQPVGLRPLASPRSPLLTVRRDSIPQTHWAAGALIGLGLGIILGNGLQQMDRELCESNCHSGSPMFYVGPMMIFGTIGGMIGSASHKKPKRALESGHDSLAAHRR